MKKKKDSYCLKYKPFTDIRIDVVKRSGYTISYRNDDTWIMGNWFGSTVISYGMVKVVWHLAYIYNVFYANYIANLGPMIPYLCFKPNDVLINNLDFLRREVKSFFSSKYKEKISNKVSPDNQFMVKKEDYGIVNTTAKRALDFFILHEYSHFVVKRDGITFNGTQEEKIKQEEDFCDKNAFEIYKEKYLNEGKKENVLSAKIGMQIALLILNAAGIDLKNFGIDHPASYKRVMNVMGNLSEEDDDSWCLLTAILGFECHFLGIAISHNNIYDDFKSATYEYLSMLESLEQEWKKE